MTYASVCSGIGAPECAWSGLPWRCAFSAEIEPFPAAVYHHHFPEVPNYGDITEFKNWPDHAIRLLVGGTPCQSFSVAGLRKGLADPRGNLALTFLALVERHAPAWVVWENVPGVLSDQGNAFGAFLGGLGQLGYGFAYGVLDAQWFGVAQRRRRVFVVGHSGGQWQRAAAVLFDAESLRGNPAPSREAGQGTAHSLAPCIGASGRGFERAGETRGQDPVIASPLMFGSGHAAGHNARSGHCKDAHITVVHSLRADGFDASEDGTGWGTPLVPECSPALKSRDYKGPSSDGDGDGAPLLPVAFQPRIGRNGHSSDMVESGVVNALSSQATGASDAAPCVAFSQNTRDEVREIGGKIAGALPAQPGMKQQTYLMQEYAVRRLTPTECERLQGFPDGWTAITYRGKPAADGPRYRALGNSMAVPVVRWIGERIKLVEEVWP